MDTLEDEKSENEWELFLTNTPVKDITPNPKMMITISSDFTVNSTLNTLNHYQILSVPILHEGLLYGMIDLMDIIGFLLLNWKQKIEVSGEEFFPEDVFFKTVDNISNFSLTNPVVPIYDSCSLYGLMMELSKYEFAQRIHRVLVKNSEDMFYSIVSQRDIITCCFSNMDYIPEEMLLKTCSELMLLNGLFTMRVDGKLIDAMNMLYYNRISGIALVDNDFRICGNIGVENFRKISNTSAKYFKTSVIAFLTLTESMEKVVTCDQNSTFAEVLRLFAESEHVSRIYAIDSEYHPVGVITYGDIITQLVSLVEISV